LATLTPPTTADLGSSKGLRKLGSKAKAVRLKDIKEGMVNIDDVDVTYEKDVKNVVLDIEDESVRDRWSRYIGAMGLEAMKK